MATDILNMRLAQIGLWFFPAIGKSGERIPGPWEKKTGSQIIHEELSGWISAILEKRAERCFGKYGHQMLVEQHPVSGRLQVCLVVDYPAKVGIVFCDILELIGKEDRRLEAFVLAALRTLTWAKPCYTYEDERERVLDWLEQEINDEQGQEVEKELQERIKWLNEGIPKRYRSVLRNGKKAEFPRTPKAPPENSWLHGWWSWSKEVQKRSADWKAPVSYELEFRDFDSENVDPNYLMPILWSPTDPIMDAFDEMMQNEFCNYGRSAAAYCLSSAEDLKEILFTLERLGEIYDLHVKACGLDRPPEKEKEKKDG
ncbi:MAG: hypothetical protein HY282_07335 [Nitrospirae bacterium]|nr:hypothetical protein [Candidatus Manganitrophaceae bacterium]